MMRRLTMFLLLLLASPSVAKAHFLWLLATAGPDGGKVQVFFGEVARPDAPQLLEKDARAQVWVVAARGDAKALELTKMTDSLEATLAGPLPPSTVILSHNFGVVSRGGAPFLLKYYAKTHAHTLPGTWRSVDDSIRLPLEITAEPDGENTRLRVTWKGKPQSGAAVTVRGPGIADKQEGTTDESGQYRCRLPQSGIYSIRAKHEEANMGQQDGQEYKSVRHHSTLTLRSTPATVTPTAHALPPLPKGTTSFGGAVVGDELFVYGGNYGSAHSYDNEDQSGDLWRLDLKKSGEWKRGPGGTKLQGLAMVEHRGTLYRAGGFNASNKPGEKEDLRSQAEFARWKPGTDSWESLPGLPEPRSSHDAVLVGDMLYVVGGWNLQGGGPTTRWHDTALAINLATDKLEWKAIARPPFKRRALAVAAWRGKLYCIGGMQENGSPTTAVAAYDPALDVWSEGPSILGDAMDGFGSSAFATSQSLFVTTISGSIQRLSADGSAWEHAGQLKAPRFFHRLLPWGDDKLVIVGGSNMSTGKTEALEVVVVKE